VVVVVREDIPGDARLVSYYIPKSGEMITASDLRGHLRESVPNYMVPQHFVELDKFPQTNNGKIDYKALPAPEGVGGADTEFIAPETEAEVYLASLWQEMLGSDSISVNENFFNIGGHSLLVMKCISRIEDDYSVRLSPQDFLMGTLEQIASDLEEENGNDSSNAVASKPVETGGGVNNSNTTPTGTTDNVDEDSTEISEKDRKYSAGIMSKLTSYLK
jgi:acyl carrier protein